MHQKEKILELRAEGKSYREIQKITGASKSTISFHLGEGQKIKNKIRSDKNKRKHPYTRKFYHYIDTESRGTNKQRKENKSPFSYGKFTSTCGFTVQDIINKLGESPKCYLTGKDINIYDISSYSFDHIIPVSRGGKSTLENLQICCSTANQCKDNLLNEEFFDLCESILKNNGYEVIKK